MPFCGIILCAVKSVEFGRLLSEYITRYLIFIYASVPEVPIYAAYAFIFTLYIYFHIYLYIFILNF
jgi:hypothetical protein